MATEKELEIQQKLLDLQDKLNNARAEEQLAIQVSIDYQKEKLKLELQTQDLRKESLKNLQTSIRDLSEQRRLEQDSGKAAQLDLELAKQRSEYSKKYLENLIASGEKDKQKLEKAKKTVEKREEELKILEQQNEQLAEQEEKYKKIKEHSKTLINNLFAIGGEYGKQIQSLFTIDGIMSRYSSMISEVMQTNESLAATTGKVGSMTADMGMGLEQFAVGYKEMGQSFNSLYKEMADFSNLNKTVQKDLAGNAAKMENLGVDASTTAQNFNNLTKSLKFGSGEITKINDKIAKSAIGAGIAPAKMAKDFAIYMPQLAAHGKKAVDVFIDLQKQSKSLGIEVGDLLSIVGNTFDTFEGGAEAAGKLNAILGGDYLNSVEMLNATESERVEMLKRSFEMSGKNFDSLDRFEKKAIAASLGIKDVNEANKLFGNTSAEMRAEMQKQAASNEELEKAQKASANTMRQLELSMNKLLVAVSPVVDGLKKLISVMAEYPTATIIVTSFVAALFGLGKIIPILSSLKILLGGFGKTAVVAGAEVGAGAAEGSAGVTMLGTAATMSAGQILALGAAITLIGLGIGIVVLSLAELVKSFSTLNGEQVWGAVAALGALAVAAYFLAPSLLALIPALIGVGGAGAVSAPGLLAVGAAVALIGAGIGAAAYGMAQLVSSISDLTSKAVNLSNLRAISTVVGEITKSIMDMPDTVEFNTKISNLKSVGQAIQIAAESAPFIAPAKEFIVAAKEYHVAQKESKGVDNDALVAAIRSSMSTTGGKTTGFGSGTPVVIKIDNATELRGHILGGPAATH